MGSPFTAITGDASWGGTPIDDVLKTSFNPKCELQAYASSDTAGWKKRLAGCKDISGTIDCLCDGTTGLPVPSTIKPGATATLVITLKTGVTISGPAMIDDISIDDNIEGGELVKATIAWSGNGVWTAF
jgi:hypothetical protein